MLDVLLPDEYPFKPPKIKFDPYNSKIWHPNVSSLTGAICINTLKPE